MTPIRPRVTKQKFEKGIEILGTALPMLVQDPGKVAVMASLLSDLTEEEFERGVKTFILRHKEVYPNTNIIAVIRYYALTDPNDPSAEEAWGELTRERNRHGIYGAWEIKNPLVAQCVEIMGRRNLCLSENEEADRAHFFKIYRALADRKKHGRIMGGF